MFWDLQAWKVLSRINEYNPQVLAFYGSTLAREFKTLRKARGLECVYIYFNGDIGIAGDYRVSQKNVHFDFFTSRTVNTYKNLIAFQDTFLGYL